MLTLLRTEFRKMLPYRTFWVILGIFTALLFLIVRSAASITINGQTAGPTLYNFPDIWQRLTYIASYFNLLLGILVIILITDEYSFRTLRQQIIDGYFRTDVIASKLLVLLSIAFYATLVVLALGLGFGFSATENPSAQQITGNMMYLLYYFVQTLGYMTVAMFAALLIRKNGLAIIAFLLYFFVEWIVRFKIDDSVNQYFPGKVLNSLAPNPTQSIIDSAVGITTSALAPQHAIFPAVFYIVLLTVLSFLILKTRDL